MQELPQHIKLKFFDTMSANIELKEFEQWVYTTNELVQALSDDNYLELISFNYNKPRAQYELFKLLQGCTDAGEYETWKLKLLLSQAKVRDKNLPATLERFYDLYCNGYYFLNGLGMGFGLAMCVLPAPNKVEHWSDLNEIEIKQLVNKLPPSIEEEVNLVLQWLDDKQIILTGEHDQYNHYEFIDNRSDHEKARIPQFNF